MERLIKEPVLVNYSDDDELYVTNVVIEISDREEIEGYFDGVIREFISEFNSDDECFSQDFSIDLVRLDVMLHPRYKGDVYDYNEKDFASCVKLEGNIYYSYETEIKLKNLLIDVCLKK